MQSVKKRMAVSVVFALAGAAACLCCDAAEVLKLSSPNGAVVFRAFAGEELRFAVDHHGRPVIGKSRMGFAFKGEKPMSGAFELVEPPIVETGLVEAWKPVVRNRHGDIRVNYNQAVLNLREATGERRRMGLTVRVGDDGVAFRYTLYGASVPGERRILDELTEYKVPATSFAWVGHNEFKGFVGPQESPFAKTPVAKIGADEWCLSPLLVKVGESDWIAITSACLDDFPGFYTCWRNGAIATRLAPSPAEGEKGVKARFSERFDTAWRVVLLAENPGRFIESEWIRSLNPPCEIKDTSWIRPGVMAWDHWWSGEVKMEMSEIFRYVDFASRQGWPYMLVDWKWYGEFNRAGADITKPAPQIDIQRVIAYARERNVRIFLWLYCTDATRNDAYADAFALYEKWGVAGVKIDFMDRYDREIVNWYRKVTKAAADHHLLVNFHGAFAPDGFDRTYPNQITREGVMGQEYNKWSALDAAHNVTLAFTRMIAGAMDYTPGGFLHDTVATHRKGAVPTRVPNTRCAELAKFIVYESPLCCFCDHPTNVIGQVGCDFVADVPTEWDDTRFVGGEPDKWVAVARRSGNKWYVGVIGPSEGGRCVLDLAFLPKGARIRSWSDGDRADEARCTASELPEERKLSVTMLPCGGFAAVIGGQ